MVMKHQFKELPLAGYGGSAFGRYALIRALNEWKAGAGEIGGNNMGIFVAKYLNRFAAQGNSWCAAYISWCYSNDSGLCPFQYSLGALALRNIFRKNKWLYFDDSKAELMPLLICPQPGDYICLDRGTKDDSLGHAALCHHREGNLLYTVEGNRSDKVEGFIYNLEEPNRIIACGRVPDTAELIPIHQNNKGA